MPSPRAASNAAMVFSPAPPSGCAPWWGNARGPGQSRKGNVAMSVPDGSRQRVEPAVDARREECSMPEVTAVPIGAERVTTPEEIVVRSPYDGSEVGRVPSCGASHVARAVAEAPPRLAE